MVPDGFENWWCWQCKRRFECKHVNYRVPIPDRQPAPHSTRHKIPVQPVENKQEEQVSQTNTRASDVLLFYQPNRFIRRKAVNFHKISIVSLCPLSFLIEQWNCKTGSVQKSFLFDMEFRTKLFDEKRSVRRTDTVKWTASCPTTINVKKSRHTLGLFLCAPGSFTVSTERCNCILKLR